jgi:tRNA 5-methylaminomethyl-2-thiouridine biosynthesis bifunctional protein
VTSPVTWGPDGTPRSARFDDVYRSRGFHGMDRGLLQAQHVFLQGCGLWSPHGAALDWQGQRQWHVLETGFGLGLGFLATWQAWQQDPQRPDRLFFTSIEAWPVAAEDLVRSVAAWPELQPLAETLARAWRGLLPGMHRLVFEGGRVQLTLGIGPVDKMLREIDVAADSVFLDGFSPDVNPEMWSLHTLRAVARLCRSGTRVASWCVKRSVRDDLAQCGFAVTRADGLPPKVHRLEAVFSPAWTPRSRLRQALWGGACGADATDIRPAAPATATASSAPPSCAAAGARTPRSALVLGAGLSGSAVACSLARRGWAVTVLDAGPGVGAGASGLPAGLTAPHVSPDDSVLSRITRAGVRATLQRCAELLQPGTDWAWSGVLEHRVEGKHALPAGDAWPAQGHAWSTPATPEQRAQAGLPPQAQALWHPMAAWLRPRQLVAAQLATPGIAVRWGLSVHAVRPALKGWQALDAQGQVLAQADQLIVACGFHTRALLPEGALPLNPLRGQISMGPLEALPSGLKEQLPPVPVNGHGSFITGIALPPEFGAGPGWYLGSTFERGCPQALLRDEDHAANHARLATLLPGLSEPMRTAFAQGQVLAWAGLRCTLPDRLPAVGALDPEQQPGLHLCAGMGARGISLNVLCGELIAAQLEGEPLPLAPSLAGYLIANRFRKLRG